MVQDKWNKRHYTVQHIGLATLFYKSCIISYWQLNKRQIFKGVNIIYLRASAAMIDSHCKKWDMPSRGVLYPREMRWARTQGGSLYLGGSLPCACNNTCKPSHRPTKGVLYPQGIVNGNEPWGAKYTSYSTQ